MEEYLTTNELSDRIKLAPGTVRNLIWKKVFLENVHFVRPTPRKILFKWSRIEDWLHNRPINDYSHCGLNNKGQTQSLINI
jgi:hypothetical protein